MTRIFATLAALLLALVPFGAAADSWPVYQNTYVNDYANIIEEGAEGRITSTLKSLREETGIEATVLTLHSRAAFQTSGSLESFATGLFNAWGIGNAETNDGILVLVLSDDRDMRIELGSGYGSGYNAVAQDIIDRSFLPAFRDGDYSNGIEVGTDAVITRIARAFHAGAAPEPVKSGGNGGLIGAIFGAIGAVSIGAALFARRISDRFTRCPQCGVRGIHTDKETLEKATRSAKGRGQRTVTCPHCGYHHSTFYAIPIISRSSSSSGGSFGGGSSSGGGASGRW